MFGAHKRLRFLSLNKDSSSPIKSPITYLALPPIARIPLVQHKGDESQVIVKRGERVTEGQVIAEAPPSAQGIRIHTPVPGIIRGIKNITLPDGTQTKNIEIQTGGNFRKTPNITPRKIENLNKARLLTELTDKGLVDHDQEAIPAHIKYNGNTNTEYLVIALEDLDPYNAIQERIVLEHPESIKDGIIILIKILKPKNIILCSSKKKQYLINQVIQLMPENIITIPLCINRICAQSLDKIIQIHLQNQLFKGSINTIQLSEILIVYPTFLYQLQQSILYRMPCIERPITIAGNGVTNPSNMFVRIGTPIRFICEECGGLNEKKQIHIITGTLQSGFTVVDLDTPICKNTSMVLILTKRKLIKSGYNLNLNQNNNNRQDKKAIFTKCIEYFKIDSTNQKILKNKQKPL